MAANASSPVVRAGGVPDTGSAVPSTLRAGAGEPGGGPVRTSRAPWVVLAITLSAVFMQMLDTTITTVAIPAMQTDLEATFGDMQLVLALYTLAFASVLVTAGRLGDLYGRKRMFLIGMVGFTAASALCSLAPSAGALIWSRVAQGLFSGLMFPQVLAILQVTFPKDKRAKALGLYGATIGLATILGPVTGGALIQLDLFGSDWRSIFYVNVPLGLLALAFGAARIPESRAGRASRLDLGGAALITIGLFLLVLPIVVGRDLGWPAWTWVMLAASVLVLATAVAYERSRTRRAADPLVPTTLFRKRAFSLGLSACLVFFCGIPSFFFVLFLTLQYGFGYSAVKAGSVSLAFALAVAIGSARSAEATKRLGSRVLSVGCVLILSGMTGVIVTLRWAGADLVAWQLLPWLFIGGLGAGLFIAPVTGVVLAGIKGDDAGAAAGLLSTAQQVGQSVGVAIVGVIFFGALGANADRAVDEISSSLRADLVAAGLPADAQRQVEADLRVCFVDRANSTDPTAEPPSCRTAQQRVEASPVPPQVKQAVATAVQDQAVPQARRVNFVESLPQALWWQLGVFALALLLVVRLPQVAIDPEESPVGGA